MSNERIEGYYDGRESMEEYRDFVESVSSLCGPHPDNEAKWPMCIKMDGECIGNLARSIMEGIGDGHE